MKTCVLILENLRSVENTASIFRTADGLGVSKIYLIGTTPTPLDRFNRERKDFAKVSLGAEKSVEWKYSKEIAPVLEEIESHDFQIITLEQTNESVRDIKNFVTLDKFALIVGNEVDGVSTQAIEKSDSVVEIPMRGQKESLNVSVATGIALFELLK